MQPCKYYYYQLRYLSRCGPYVLREQHCYSAFAMVRVTLLRFRALLRCCLQSPPHPHRLGTQHYGGYLVIYHLIFFRCHFNWGNRDYPNIVTDLKLETAHPAE